MDLGESRYAATEQKVSGSDNYELIGSEPNRYRTSELALATLESSVSAMLTEIIQALRTTRSLSLAFSFLTVLTLGFALAEAFWPDWSLLATGAWRFGTLAMEVLALITGASVVTLAVRRIRMARRTRRRLAGEIRSRRMIHPGSNFVTISFGEKGVRLKSRTRTLDFEWQAVDRELLPVENPALGRLLSPPPPPATLEALVRGDVTGPAAQSFLQRARTFAQTAAKALDEKERGLRLPLRIDAESRRELLNEEAQRLGVNMKKHGGNLPAAVAPFDPVEYVFIPARFFMNGQDDAPWQRAASLALYMLARLADPPPA